MSKFGFISVRIREGVSYRNILEKLVKRPVAIFLITGFLTTLLAVHLPNLVFRTSIYDLVVEDLPDTTRYEVFKSLFGSEEIIRVVIKSEDVFDPAAFLKITQLSETAAGIEWERAGPM
jgi:predicted RND superfamily exporter protein